jgi:hypothetical protein
LRNPFFVELLESAEQAAMAPGFSVLLDITPSVQETYKVDAPWVVRWSGHGMFKRRTV